MLNHLAMHNHYKYRSIFAVLPASGNNLLCMYILYKVDALILCPELGFLYTETKIKILLKEAKNPIKHLVIFYIPVTIILSINHKHFIGDYYARTYSARIEKLI
jgi:hypothetical protein